MDIKVISVVKVNFSTIDKSGKKILFAYAEGKGCSSGWTKGRLVPPGGLKEIPSDGIINFDFIASVPNSYELNILSPISGTGCILIPEWLKGIRVHAAMNEIEVLLIDKSVQIDLNPRGDDFVPVPWVINCGTEFL